MPIDNEWRGDAPPVAQVTTLTIQQAVPGSQYTITINGKSLSVGGSGSPSAIAQALADAWQLSTIPEFQEIGVEVAGAGLTLTAREAGKPFEITASFPALITVTRQQPGVARQVQVTTIVLPGNTTGGTWNLTLSRNGIARTETGLAWNVSAATLQSALNGSGHPELTGITSVTKTGLTYTLTFDETAVAYKATVTVDADALVGNGSVTVQTIREPGNDVHEVQGFVFTDIDLAYADTFTITNPDVAEATSTPRPLGEGDVQSAFDEVYGQHVVTVFEAQFTSNQTGLINRLFVVRWNDPGSRSVCIMNSTRDDLPPVIRLQSGGGAAKPEIFLFTTSGSADAGTPEIPLTPDTFTFTVDGETTADIQLADQVATIEGAVQALSTVGAGQFDIPLRIRNGQDSGEAYDVFVGVLWGNQDRTVSADTSPNAHSLTTAQASAPLVNEIQRITIEGTGGSWGLIYPAHPSSPGTIAYDASASTVQTQIDAILDAGGGDCSVTKYSARSYDVEFIGDLAATNIDQLVGDGSALTGGASAAIGTTGPVVGQNEIQTVRVDPAAIAGTWVLIAEGVTSAIAWNATAAQVEAALEAIVTIGAGNVSVTGDAGFFVVEFVGALAYTPLPLMVANAEALVIDPSILGLSTTQRSRGPEHFDDPLNWTLGHVCEDGERPVFRRGKTGPKYGCRQRATFEVIVDDPKTGGVETQTSKLRGRADFVANQKVRLTTTGTLPAGLATDTDYFVVTNDRDLGILELAATGGGAPVQISDAGTGTHTIAVEFDGVLQWANHSGHFGLPRFSKSGKYWEYRNRALVCGVKPNTRVTIGQGESGGGSGLVRLSTGDYPVTLEVIATGTPADTDTQAAWWSGRNAANAIEMVAGSLAIDEATFGTLIQRGGTIVGTESVEMVAGGMIDKTGGTLYLHSSTAGDRVLRLRG